ncbi:YXWGXW repeat-containing protein [Solimonas soli]|uniref:YXWGXW repeat-containing protein n=1 Tax=Solimonas soli TaxID=413479 RepID=UPI0004B7D47F|nr:YXWGXW repeat-containing protein [Solimonas soli]
MATLWFRVSAALLALAVVAPCSARASTSVFISVNTAPPPLPVYEQPWCPGPGYVWTPGYWAWNGDDYYWVPGAWVIAPVGMLWTPGYWGWADGVYVWHAGYWGPRVGYYGGINYGYGYTGYGYAGGYWRDRVFYYNRTVNRVDVTRVRNVYERKVTVNNITVDRVSYNGGDGGTRARPSRDDEAYTRQRHFDATDEQRRLEDHARQDRRMAASENRGRPPQSFEDRDDRDARQNPRGDDKSPNDHRDSGARIDRDDRDDDAAQRDRQAQRDLRRQQEQARQRPMPPPQRREPQDEPGGRPQAQRPPPMMDPRAAQRGAAPRQGPQGAGGGPRPQKHPEPRPKEERR